MKYARLGFIAFTLFLASCQQSPAPQASPRPDSSNVLAMGSVALGEAGLAAASLDSDLVDGEDIAIEVTSSESFVDEARGFQYFRARVRVQNLSADNLENLTMLAISLEDSEDSLSPFSGVTDQDGNPLRDVSVLAQIRPVHGIMLGRSTDFVAYSEEELSETLLENLETLVAAQGQRLASVFPYGFRVGDLEAASEGHVDVTFRIPVSIALQRMTFRFALVTDSVQRVSQDIDEIDVVDGVDIGYSSAAAVRLRFARARVGLRTLVLIGPFRRFVNVNDLNADIFSLVADIRLIGAVGNPLATLLDSGSSAPPVVEAAEEEEEEVSENSVSSMLNLSLSSRFSVLNSSENMGGAATVFVSVVPSQLRFVWSDMLTALELDGWTVSAIESFDRFRASATLRAGRRVIRILVVQENVRTFSLQITYVAGFTPVLGVPSTEADAPDDSDDGDSMPDSVLPGAIVIDTDDSEEGSSVTIEVPEEEDIDGVFSHYDLLLSLSGWEFISIDVEDDHYAARYFLGNVLIELRIIAISEIRFVVEIVFLNLSIPEPSAEPEPEPELDIGLCLRISPHTWNTNWARNTRGALSVRLSCQGISDIDLDSIVMIVDDERIEAVSADRRPKHIDARFDRGEAFGLLTNPQPGERYTITIEVEVAGQIVVLEQQIRVVGPPLPEVDDDDDDMDDDDDDDDMDDDADDDDDMDDDDDDDDMDDDADDDDDMDDDADDDDDMDDDADDDDDMDDDADDDDDMDDDADDDDIIDATVTLENGFTISLVSVSSTTWTYSVEALDDAQNLSNWVLELPVCVSVVSASPDDFELVDPDPNADFSGIKWNVEEGFAAGEFIIELDAEYAIGLVQVAAKSADIALADIAGPACADADDDVSDDDADDGASDDETEDSDTENGEEASENG